MLNPNGESGIFGKALSLAYDAVVKESNMIGTYYYKVEVFPFKGDERVFGRTYFNANIIKIGINKNAFKYFHDQSRTMREIVDKITEILRHEFRHVMQLIKLKKLLGTREKALNFMGKMSKRFKYFDNPLEVDARSCESIGFAVTDCFAAMQTLVKLYA